MHLLRGDSSSTDEQASFWLARMRSDSVSARDRVAFDRWLTSDPSHEAAYSEYRAVWDGMQDLAADDAVLAMRKEALEASPAPRRYEWHKLPALAASLAIFLLAGLFLFDSVQPGPAIQKPAFAQLDDARRDDGSTFRTEVGQRSTLTLADGSVIELNTDSLVRVDYSDERRGVRLLRGQALFEVAHDSTRPFVVEAGGQRITALGTAFDVRLRSGELRVTLIEGEVAVESAEASGEAGGAEARRLRPGQQLLAAADAPAVVRPANVEQAVSWRTGRVIFSDEPLGQVVQEINRYSRRKVVLDDPSLADLRVSGIFRAGSVDNFVTALDSAFPIASRSDQTRDEIVLTWD